MTLIRGYDLWICEHCGKSETRRSDEYDNGYYETLYPDGWASEALCDVCDLELHPPRPDAPFPEWKEWHSDLLDATKARLVLADLVEKHEEMNLGNVLHIEHLAKPEVRT